MNLDVIEEQEHIPLEVAILAAFLFYGYKFLSRFEDKDLYDCPKGQEHGPITDSIKFYKPVSNDTKVSTYKNIQKPDVSGFLLR
ncbi:hypothetical protein MKY48_17105 [Paenibacillus sp. FSL W8-0187]|uniref:hypothetical protein n=1 Tax=unclassified Paenibacillus TaxID=185978 RepID=UPI0030D912FB